MLFNIPAVINAAFLGDPSFTYKIPMSEIYRLSLNVEISLNWRVCILLLVWKYERLILKIPKQIRLLNFQEVLYLFLRNLSHLKIPRRLMLVEDVGTQRKLVLFYLLWNGYKLVRDLDILFWTKHLFSYKTIFLNCHKEYFSSW